ncbi:MAG: tRNA (adenosine(37)-N6)-dimethylallyltransferase MiaA [Elusimicrobiota bacterium]
MKKIPVLLGPTASGKTSIGILLAKELNAEIISVDSRKVYKGLKIGTATPEGIYKNNTYIVEGIPHYLIAHLNPDEAYNAGSFVRDATELIKDIQSRGKLPLLVGGTGFYFKALESGLPDLPQAQIKMRIEIQKRIQSEGTTELYNEFKAKDPEAAEQIHPNDRHKIIRGLEIIHFTGEKYSSYKNQKKKSPFDFITMALTWPKDLLDQRIKERSAQMEREGMLEETEKILSNGFPYDCPALVSFGYKEAVQVIRGEIPRSEFLPLLIRGTIAYSKRQKTWLKTQTQAKYFECDLSSKKREISLKMRDFLETQSI